MTIRVRNRVDHFHSSDHYWTNGSLLTPQVYILQSQKTVDSEGHPYRRLGGKNTLDIGGPFAARGFSWDDGKTSKPLDVFSLSTQTPTNPTNYRTYSGPIAPSFVDRSTLPTGSSLPIPLGASQMNTYGTMGVASSIPTNPLVNIGQFAAELREIPRLFNPIKWRDTVRGILNSSGWQKLRRSGNATGAAADEYLNYQFGWRPFLKDLGDFLDVTDDLEKRVRFLLNNSGKTVRRKRTLLEKVTTEAPVTLSNSSYGAPVLHADFYKTTGQLLRDRKYTEKVWFSGGFTYFLDGDGDLSDDRTRKHIERILNSPQLNPNTVWNVAPWTWALGWISNSSALAKNYHYFSQDGLVMRYGYIMRSLTQTDTFTLKGLQFKNKLSGPKETYLYQSLTLTSKQRYRATPFGFGLTPENFTPRQWSIIAALGISNAPRKLF